MKKNFTTPSIDVLMFEFENIVLTSGITAVQSILDNENFGADEDKTTVTLWTEMIKTTL